MTSGRRPGVSAWAMAHEAFVWALFAVLLVAGAVGFHQLPVKRFPTVQLPAVAVSASVGNASPAELEQMAARLEAALARLPAIHRIWTQAGAGKLVTVAQFDSRRADQPLDRDVRSAISGLELGPQSPVTVRRLEVESTPMLTYAVTSSVLPPPLLSAYVDRLVLPRLRSIAGASSVRRLGGSDQHLEITLLPTAMSKQRVTALSVSGALDRSRTKPVTEASLKRLLIPAAERTLVPLAQIGTIGEEPDASSAVTFDGEQAVGFSVAKAPDADSLALDAQVARIAAELEGARPDIAITKIWSTADETAAALHATARALIEGMALAALVVLLFLKDLRSTLVVAIAMPASLLPTFAVLAAAGYSLDMVTLLALTLAVGILVDDAIVEVENIQRLVKGGEPPRSAAPEGADRIALAVVATTAAIVAVFAPVSFLPGVAGRFFAEFGLTVSTAVVMSLLVARLWTPILAARLLKPGTRPGSHPRCSAYDKVLRSAVKRPVATILAVIAIAGASTALAPLLPTEFQPAPDPDFYVVSVVTEPGSGIADLQSLVAKASALIRRRSETRHMLVHFGATAEGGGVAGISLGEAVADPRSARIAVALDPGRHVTLAEIRASLRPSFQRLTGGTVVAEPPSGSADLQLLLTGDDPKTLEFAHARLMVGLRQLGSIADVRPLLQGLAERPTSEPRPRRSFRPGEYEAALALSTTGKFVGDASTADGASLPVHVRAPSSGQRLANIPLLAADGELVSLPAVGPSMHELRTIMLRLDGHRVEGVDADLAPGVASGEAMGDILRLPAVRSLPAGVALVPTGDQEEMAKLFRSMAVALIGAMIAVYATLALLFHSLLLPLIVAASLPLALGGGVLGLLASGSALNLPALIGFLLLIGLAAKNSILLVEDAARRMREGSTAADSVVEACRRRSRAVIMTSVAMAAGMLPAALSLGAGDEFRQPMAFAVIGGLIGSTALSLLFVPALFVLCLSGFKSRVTGRRER